MTFKTIPAGTVTEHLLAWDGEDSSLPEWTADLEVEDARADEGTSCNTRKDRQVTTSVYRG